MKVIVVTKTGIGGVTTDVYEYTKNLMKKLIKDEFNWAKKYSTVDNEDEVEEVLEEDEICEAHIIESEYGIHYEVCDVMVS